MDSLDKLLEELRGLAPDHDVADVVTAVIDVQSRPDLWEQVDAGQLEAKREELKLLLGDRGLPDALEDLRKGAVAFVANNGAQRWP